MIQRIYETQYSRTQSISSSPKLPPECINGVVDYSVSRNVLIRSLEIQHTGIAKGIHVDGSLSEKMAVKLIDESDICHLLRPISTNGKPFIVSLIRSKAPGVTKSAHACFSTELSEETAEDPGFFWGAMSHHVKMNSRGLQPSIEVCSYFAMYIIHREVSRA